MNSNKQHITKYILDLVNDNLKPKYNINENCLKLLKNRILNDDIDGIKLLLDHNININLLDSNGFSLLHYSLVSKKIRYSKIINIISSTKS